MTDLTGLSPAEPPVAIGFVQLHRDYHHRIDAARDLRGQVRAFRDVTKLEVFVEMQNSMKKRRPWTQHTWLVGAAAARAHSQ